MNCARRGCGHSEGLHRADGKCWACGCAGLTFAALSGCAGCGHSEAMHDGQGRCLECACAFYVEASA